MRRDSKMRKRMGYLVCLTLLTTLLTGLTIQAEVKSFKDVPSNAWYKASLDYIMNYGEDIISGYPDGTFKPNEILTVEQFIKCVIEAAGIKDLQPVVKGTWSTPYIDKAKEQGYLLDNEFTDLTRPITRGEMARIVIRSIEDITGEVSYRKSSELIDQIKDYNSIKTELKDYVVKCYDAGIIVGYPDGTFGADKSLTRAEAISVLRNLIDTEERQVPSVAIEIEGILFDPIKDVTEEGAMDLEKQEEFVTKFFESIRFYEENGSSYVKGYLPEVPEGFQWGVGLYIYYKDGSKDRYYAGFEGREDTRIALAEEFKFKLSGGKNDLVDFGIVVSVESEKKEESGRFFLYYPELQYGIDDPKEYNIIYRDFDWEKVFEW
jgi:hypothetical protein